MEIEQLGMVIVTGSAGAKKVESFPVAHLFSRESAMHSLEPKCLKVFLLKFAEEVIDELVFHAPI